MKQIPPPANKVLSNPHKSIAKTKKVNLFKQADFENNWQKPATQTHVHTHTMNFHQGTPPYFLQSKTKQKYTIHKFQRKIFQERKKKKVKPRLPKEKSTR